MSEGNVAVVTDAGVVQSPPPVKLVERPVVDERKELAQLAGEVARRGSRKLLWEYLRLRSKVMGR